MTLKTLLLGSAAAFAVIGGAQAADLSVAEPVESVKVCDTFGSGYWYIPGSDTCLKVGGHVEFDINLHDSTETTDGHSSNWDFVTGMGLSFDASSMTDVGRLDGHVAVKGTYSGDRYGSTDVLLDGAYLKIGALKAGHFGSTFNPDSNFTDDFGLTNVIKSSLADSNQLQLSWAAAGFGLALGIEDPRESFGSSLPEEFSMPLITGAITASQAAWSGRVSAGFVQLDGGTSWGVDGEITFKLDSIAAGDQLRLNVAYGDDQFTGGGLYFSPYTPTNDGWSAFASFQHMFSSTLRFDIDYNYLQYSDDNGTKWGAAADLVWLPYAGFKAKVGVGYSQVEGDDGVWKAQVALRRDW